MKAKWYLGDELLDESEIGMGSIKGTKHVPFSIVWVCPKCGDAWGKIAVEHEQTLYSPRRRRCPQHGTGFLGAYDQKLYKQPAKVMMREYKLLQANPQIQNYDNYLALGDIQ